MRFRDFGYLCAFVAFQVATQPLAAQTKLLRFPTIHGDQIAFSYAGDIWRVSSEGGTAIRLTTHPGLELFPRFSPDGQQIAFTGQYEGDEQVYVIPATGGIPQQLTFYPARGPLPDRWGYDNQVYGWTRDGRAVLFRSHRDGWTLGSSRLFAVSVDGGLPEALPMRVSGAGDLSPDGDRVVFSPLFRDFRTWKRYEGGWAQDLFLFDLKTFAYEQLTDHPRTERDPMWIGDRIYFASDRDDTLNLYYLDLATRETHQATHSTAFDVRWPSRGEAGQIVYELGGELYVLDTPSGDSRKVSIHVPTDGLAMRPRRISVADQISGIGLSPDANRVVVAARGDIFTVPAEKGPTRNLTNTSGEHDKWPHWSPDGSKIVFLSDRTGEEELYLIDQRGDGQPEQLTDNGQAMRYRPIWSPDGARLAFSDKSGKLYVLVLDGREIAEIADEARGQLLDFSWSPCGGHLAFSMTDPNGWRSLHIWSVDGGQARRITGEHFHEFSPAWDPDGKYLYYLSNRQFAPQICTVEWNYVMTRSTGIFALALRRDVPHPLPTESDEATVDRNDQQEDDPEPDSSSKDQETAEEESQDGAADEHPEDAAYTEIDFEGLSQRVVRLPLEDDNYQGLSAIAGHVLYVRGGPFFYGRDSGVRSELRIFSFKDRKATTLAEGVNSYVLAADGKKLATREGRDIALYDAKPEGKASRKAVPLSGLMADVDPRQEWVQIFHEVWRRYRDFFYVSNMHGYDWPALRRQYEPLLDHVAHRSDLNYVIGEMIAELNAGHAYKAGGDWVQPERPRFGLPGARLHWDAQAGRYRIASIYAGHNEEPIYRSPLTEIDVDVQVGDYLLEIEGHELKENDNPYQLLRNRADQPVTWTVNSQPQSEGARQITYRPVTSEQDLVYLDWVLANQAKVDQMTEGRVGYLHLPNMGPAGIREFTKWYYGQIRKEGLVIDVRSNGGGNVSAMLIQRLNRSWLATGFARTSDTPTTYPRSVFIGPMVCLLDQNSASDGDIFPAMFREAGLGPLIGKRSWGGVIGITNRGTLIDGGVVNVPEFGFASTDGRWIIEGYGVDPDIEVDNDPKSLVEGRDPQLERGIKEVIQRMSEQQRRLPERPPAPIKTP
jgi:tricorn protease